MNSNFGSQVANPFLLSVLEGLVDGILILNPQGEALYANTPAAEVAKHLKSETLVPTEVWRSCEALIDSRELYGDRPLVIESEFSIQDSITYRVRVQWLKLDGYEDTCLLVRLEDQRRSLESLALTEAKKYGLTAREAEVWFLRRCNLSRKEIASQLFITIDTVKKHLGNIQAKRQSHQESWC